MKKAFIGISGICANTGISFIENIEIYVSIACSIIICIATLIATFKKSKSKTPKEIEIKEQEQDVKTVEEEIIKTAHNIQELINKKGGNDGNGKVH